MAIWRRYKCHDCGYEFDGLHYSYDGKPYDCKSCESGNTEVLSEEVTKAAGYWNKETSFSSPVKSMVDGRHYTSRKAWDDHLKAHRCVEVGNDSSVTKPNPRAEIKGDFNVKKELKQAIQQVLQK